MKLINKIRLVALFLSLSVFLSVYPKKVFMIGDSHVFGKVYPNTTSEVLKKAHPETEFSYWGKNGICFYSLNSNPEYLDSLYSFSPDIVIIHLGTNGAYASNFTRKAFRNEMETFFATFRDSLPDCQVVFVTPFTNKRRKYKKKGRWHINNRNRDAADEIIEFVGAHPNTFVVDNNAEVGMKFLQSRNLIRRDNVHLTPEGYVQLGTMVANEILQIPELWSREESQDKSDE